MHVNEYVNRIAKFTHEVLCSESDRDACKHPLYETFNIMSAETHQSIRAAIVLDYEAYLSTFAL